MKSAELLHHLDIARGILESLNCPRALTVHLLLKAGQFVDVLELVTVPENYLDADAFALAYQATKLLSKATWLPTGIDTKAKALETFWGAEAANKLTNEYLIAIRSGQASSLFPDFESALSRIRKEIRLILKSANYLSFLDHSGFGPGADLSSRRGKTAAYNKMHPSHSVTRKSTRYLDFIIQHSKLCQIFQWDIDNGQLIVDRVEGNRIEVVPKNAKTDRTIAIEPRWNVFFQKGVGYVIREALRRSGCDLNDQTRNQRCAMQGSLTGHLATLDMKSASDTVSLELVRELLDPKLFSIMDDLRSESFSHKGIWYRSEKFSSMGNGFTFELESLIFLAVARSVCGYVDVSIYGDDIIVPSSKAREVVEILRHLGFSVNQEKSFITGPFRESCGGDFFNGVNVTPIYWKDPLHDKGNLRLVNQVSSVLNRRSGGALRTGRLRKVHWSLVNRLPTCYKVFGPYTLSTVVHTHSSKWAVFQPKGKARKKETSYFSDTWEGRFLKTTIPVSLKFRFYDYERAVLATHFQPSSDGYSVRDRIALKTKEIFVSEDWVIKNDTYFEGKVGFEHEIDWDA